jgi:hypothetical protein|tara:strand:- start:14140 stop:14616 length:477 start_codon:yes stop_codon:yes gene_type:complete
MKYEIVEATELHCVAVGLNIRESDKEELAAGSGHKPIPALLDSLYVSDKDMVFAVLYDSKPVAMFGCNKLTDEIGGAWLLATDGIYSNKRDFIVKSREMMDLFHTRYPYLTNFIDTRNTTSIKWLESMGWVTIQRIKEYGVGKKPFVQMLSNRGETNV